MIEDVAGLKFEEAGLSPGSPVKRFTKTFRTEHSVKLHYHLSAEVNVCRGVQGRVLINGISHPFTPDCLIYMPPGTPHAYQILPSAGRMEIFHILCEAFTGGAAAVQTGTRPVFLSLDDRTAPVLKRLEDLSASENGHPLIRSGLFLQFAGELFSAAGPMRPFGQGTSADFFLTRVIGYTEEHYREKISIDEVCGFSGFSRYYFCRVFKRKTGETYFEYLTNVRLNKSLEELKAGRSVSDTAFLCGFESVSYFIKCFKSVYSTTPGVWIRKNAEILMKDGGFVFSQIHNIVTGVPPENITAMYDEINRIRY